MASGVCHDRQWCTGASLVEVHQDDERARACDGQGKAEGNRFVHPEEMKAKGRFHCHHHLLHWRVVEKTARFFLKVCGEKTRGNKNYTVRLVKH